MEGLVEELLLGEELGVAGGLAIFLELLANSSSRIIDPSAFLGLINIAPFKLHLINRSKFDDVTRLFSKASSF